MLHELIRPNLIGFFIGLSITDNIFFTLKAMEWAVESQKPMVMLLLDFEKANDREQ